MEKEEKKLPPLHIPALRFGKAYTSLDTIDILNPINHQTIAKLSRVNAGIIRRDSLKFKESREKLREIPIETLLEMAKRAGHLFMKESLPLTEGILQSPNDYVENLSLTSGIPHHMIKENMSKINFIFTNMRTILMGLTRNLDLQVLDRGKSYGGPPLNFYPCSDVLGVVLPSNSPGVNSLWIPSVILKIPVIIKPGHEEPWTPFRIIQACIHAGIPSESFGFYPTDHEGVSEIIHICNRSMIFGDKGTTEQWANDPSVQVHGPGNSKILIGMDCIENWRDYIDVMVTSICENGGRSCVNASAIVVPKYAREIAEELAKRLAPLSPLPLNDPKASLCAFSNPKIADWIDETITEGLKTEGAEEMTMRHDLSRKQTFEGRAYLLPTIIYCHHFQHPLANREFLFPYASVVEMPQEQMLANIGYSLAVTAITRDQALIDALKESSLIDRLNVGPISTMKVAWDQPHEGNIFEFLYKRRAIVYFYAP